MRQIWTNGPVPEHRLALGYAAFAPDAPLQLSRFDIGELAPGEIIVQVSHCGLCASDVDLIDDAFGAGGYPMVLGHEAVGHVEAIGAAVSGISMGDRVGIGPIRGSCGECCHCVAHRETYCADVKMTAAPGGAGGFATRMRIPADFAFGLPEAIASADAAPLMCAGLTTFAALRRLVLPDDHVGVLGIGGLGHLAVQFAKKLGHRVTALVLAPTDKDRGRCAELGADAVIDVSNVESLRTITGSLDLLLATAGGQLPLRRLMHAVAPDGRVCLIGGSTAPLDLTPISLIHHQRSISGAAAGTRDDMRAMLAFAATSGIRPWCEVSPIDQINDVISRFRAGTVRYRAVLSLESLTACDQARSRLPVNCLI